MTKKQETPTTVSATIITGDSKNKRGSTSLLVGTLNEAGSFIVRDYDTHVAGCVDQLASKVPASSAGFNSERFLGTWFTRNVGFPAGKVIYCVYKVKSVSDPLPKMLPLAFVADPTAALVQLFYPVVTDTHSTLASLTISGRFRLASAEDIERDIKPFEHTDFSPVIMNNVLDFYRDMDDEDAEFVGERVMGHWNDTSKELISNADEAGYRASLFAVNAGRQALTVTIQRILPAIRHEKAVKARTTKNEAGKKISIASRKRRIKL